jgi:hypothetical protein
MQFVEDQKRKGQTITATLRQIGIKRSTYYSWFKPVKDKGKTPCLLPRKRRRPLREQRNNILICGIDRYKACSRIKESIFPAVLFIII